MDDLVLSVPLFDGLYFFSSDVFVVNSQKIFKRYLPFPLSVKKLKQRANLFFEESFFVKAFEELLRLYIILVAR